MLIVTEGVDGSGKSTLLDRIGASMGVKAHRLHSGPLRTTPQFAYVTPLLDYRAAPLDARLVDRWHVGEMVYGPLFRGVNQLTPEMAAWIEMFLDSRGALKLWLNTPYSVVKQRLTERGEDLLKKEDVKHVIDFYREYCSKTHGWFPVDYEYDDWDINAIVKWAQRKADVVRDRLDASPSYVGADQPDVLFVLPRTPRWCVAGIPTDSATLGARILRAMSTLEDGRPIGFINRDEWYMRPESVEARKVVHVELAVLHNPSRYISWVQEAIA